MLDLVFLALAESAVVLLALLILVLEARGLVSEDSQLGFIVESQLAELVFVALALLLLNQSMFFTQSLQAMQGFPFPLVVLQMASLRAISLFSERLQPRLQVVDFESARLKEQFLVVVGLAETFDLHPQVFQTMFVFIKILLFLNF